MTSAASAAANAAGPHARHHRRGNSDPFEYDEPKFQDEILAGLADSASDWATSSSSTTRRVAAAVVGASIAGRASNAALHFTARPRAAITTRARP